MVGFGVRGLVTALFRGCLQPLLNYGRDKSRPKKARVGALQKCATDNLTRLLRSFRVA